MRYKASSLSDADTAKVLLYLKLGDYYNHNNLDSASYFGYEAIRLSRELHFPRGECWGYSLLAGIADHSGDLARSFEYAVTSLRLAENLDEGRKDLMCKAYTRMGFFEHSSGHTRDAIDYFRKALQIAKEGDLPDSTFFQVYSHLSRAFRIEGHQDSAYYYAIKGYDLSRNSETNYLKPLARNALGLVMEEQGDTRKALQYYHEAEFVAKKLNHLFALSNTYDNLARFFNRSGNTDSALFFAKKSLEIIEKCQFGAYLPEAANQLSTAYELMDKPDSALKYLRTMLIVKDSVLNQSKRQQLISMTFEENSRNERLQAEKQAYITRVRTFIMIGFLIVLSVISILLFRNYRLKSRSSRALEKKSRELENAMDHLRATQAQLIHSEKMASLGELTAGIAHEIQNPLNFVKNFSEINTELIDELKEELETGNLQLATELADEIRQNEEKIAHHGTRADGIVKSMLQHSRASSGKRVLTDLNALCYEYLRLAFHGFRAKDKSFNAEFRTDFDPSIPKIEMVPQEIGRVLLNLANNAFYAVSEKSKQNIPGYEPTVILKTSIIPPLGDRGAVVEISVTDNGGGIPDAIKEKIFQPFFTTKPTGQGTGLGLSLSYDIIKAHGGEISVETNKGEGTTFIIRLNHFTKL